MVKNEIFDVIIDNFSSDGDGVARIDGQVVFVKNAIPGEKCRIKILKVGKSAAYGKIEEILAPSEHRITPDCQNFGKCGGCGLMHMDYSKELEFKKSRVLEAMRRIGGLDIDDISITGSPEISNYRNKCIYAVGRGKNGKPVAGFFRPRSHDIIPSTECAIQASVSHRAAAAVCRWMDKYSVAPYNEQDGSGTVRHIFCRYGFSSGQAQAAIVCAKDRIPEAPRLVDMLMEACPELTSIVLNVNKTRGNTVFGGQFRTLWGKDSIMDSLCGLNFKLSARSFYQINHAQAQNLYNCAVSLAGLTGTETVLDLYCGTGTITLCLASRAKKVIGAEIVPEAIADANENALRNDIENASFICADAFKAAAQLEQSGLKPDVVVVDPPRKGLAPEVIEIICSMSPKRIVYVSCDPATLARDIKLFSSYGYLAEHVEAFDMFPRTPHIESVCLLVQAEHKIYKI